MLRFDIYFFIVFGIVILFFLLGMLEMGKFLKFYLKDMDNFLKYFYILEVNLIGLLKFEIVLLDVMYLIFKMNIV